MATLPPPRKRRLISIGSVLGLLVLVTAFLPVLLAVGVVADLLTGPRKMRFTRLGLFTSALLTIEAVGIFQNFRLRALSGFGFRKGPAMRRRYADLQFWYTSSLLQAAERFLGMSIQIEGLEHAEVGNVVLVGRHCSLPDALLPSAVFGRFDHELKYVLAGGLQWVPNIDLAGGGLDNTFVNRSADARGADLDPITAMGSRVSTDSVSVIFPEGTFFTPERRERALARISERRPDEFDRANKLQFLLPPQHGGFCALLDGASTADVVLMGHVGFDQLATVDDIVSSVPPERPMKIRLWRFPRDTVPTETKARVDWLYEQWAALDEWIGENQ